MPCCDPEDVHKCIYRKRLGFKRIFRYRPICKDEGRVLKFAYMEANRMDQQPEDYLEEISEFAAGDPFNLPEMTTMYSLRKRRRWELVSKIPDELPESGTIYGMKCELASVSFVHLQRSRSENINPFPNEEVAPIPLTYREFICDQYRFHISHLIINHNGILRERKGKFPRQMKILPGDPDSSATRIHLQYILKDYEFSYNLHNSDKWKVYKATCRINRSRTNKKFLLRKEVDQQVKCMDLQFQTGTFEQDENLQSNHQQNQIRSLVFGDFLFILKKPRRKRRSFDQDFEFIFHPYCD